MVKLNLYKWILSMLQGILIDILWLSQSVGDDEDKILK
jgi:hypothetical protein